MQSLPILNWNGTSVSPYFFISLTRTFDPNFIKITKASQYISPLISLPDIRCLASIPPPIVPLLKTGTLVLLANFFHNFFHASGHAFVLGISVEVDAAGFILGTIIVAYIILTILIQNWRILESISEEQCFVCETILSSIFGVAVLDLVVKGHLLMILCLCLFNGCSYQIDRIKMVVEVFYFDRITLKVLCGGKVLRMHCLAWLSTRIVDCIFCANLCSTAIFLNPLKVSVGVNRF